MSITFTKLFSSITASTVWCEDPETKIVWITMLAMADKRGRVWASIPGLAAIARVTLEGCEIAIGKFTQPDRYSRTKDNEGRRIEEIDGGWRLLNYDKYRAIQDNEERKEYKREWIKDKRRQTGLPVDSVDTGRHQYTQAEAEAEAEAEAKKEKNKSTEARSARQPARKRCPDGFSITEEMRTWALENAPGVDLAYQTQSFKDYEFRNAHSDWEATWRNWMRKAPKGTPAVKPTGWNEHKDLVILGPRKGQIYDQAKKAGKSFGSQEEFDRYVADVLREVRA